MLYRRIDHMLDQELESSTSCEIIIIVIIWDNLYWDNVR